MSTAFEAAPFRKLTALRADLFFVQIVSRNWLPKRCALGPMAPLNLRFAGGLLCQQKRGDVDGVGGSVPPLVIPRGVVDRALRGPFL